MVLDKIKQLCINHRKFEGYVLENLESSFTRTNPEGIE